MNITHICRLHGTAIISYSGTHCPMCNALLIIRSQARELGQYRMLEGAVCNHLNANRREVDYTAPNIQSGR